MALYRVLITLFAAFALARAWRAGVMRARLGRGAAKPGPHVWWHGASNGELNSARPVLKRVIAARPDLNLLVTCNSNTGVALIDSWALPRTTARPAPVDLAWVSVDMMQRWNVVAHVSLEAEIWPHRVLLCPGPVLMLGARMSAGTAKSWGRLPRLANRVLSRLTWVSAQDMASIERLKSLGLADRARGPVVDLKALYTPPAQQPDATLRARYARNSTWLAASTHDGEDEIVLRAHLRARAHEPALRLILAPRHPARADALEARISALGLSCARRSRADADQADVYLADTMGEMALWYALSGRVFIGGTLTDRGGHTPYEPAAYGAALLHGPDVANFKAPFASLAEADAAAQIHDATSLADALTALRDPARQKSQGARAQAALRSAVDLDHIVDHVLRNLPRALERS